MRSYQKYRNNLWPQVVQESERGFSLVELMIAIVVLSIGFLASASMQISAVDMNSSARAMTEATTVAQCRLEEVMALEYTCAFTDPGLIDDAIAGTSEPFTDSSGNGLRDSGEFYVDANGNGVWDAAHVDPSPPPGYTISWSVMDNRPVEHAKFIRMYVTRNDKKKTVLLSCIKPRE